MAWRVNAIYATREIRLFLEALQSNMRVNNPYFAVNNIHVWSEEVRNTQNTDLQYTYISSLNTKSVILCTHK